MYDDKFYTEYRDRHFLPWPIVGLTGKTRECTMISFIQNTEIVISRAHRKDPRMYDDKFYTEYGDRHFLPWPIVDVSTGLLINSTNSEKKKKIFNGNKIMPFKTFVCPGMEFGGIDYFWHVRLSMTICLIFYKQGLKCANIQF